LLLDEVDTFAKENEDLRGVIDAGHRRDGAVIRTVGDNHEPRQFSCWAPMALAAIGHLPGTIEDRSVIIQLRRRRPDELVESLRLDRADALDELARKAARWAADHLDELRRIDPEMPDGIYNRVADNWRPLLAIADQAGGEWPERARQAAVELTTGTEHEEGSASVTLLADIRSMFDTKGADRMTSDDLVAHLIGLDERRWPDWKNGRPISKAQAARLLKPFGISPKTIRVADRPTAKGYYLAAFEDAFARYLPFQNVTPSQDAQNKASDGFLKRHNGSDPEGLLRFENSKPPSNSASCYGVTDRETHLDDEDIIAFEERAAIREFDGGYSRAEAEHLARGDLAPRRR
jgi:putative DNA primase/helicase